jgi:hypothetical protein
VAFIVVSCASPSMSCLHLSTTVAWSGFVLQHRQPVLLNRAFTRATRYRADILVIGSRAAGQALGRQDLHPGSPRCPPCSTGACELIVEVF